MSAAAIGAAVVVAWVIAVCIIIVSEVVFELLNVKRGARELAKKRVRVG